MDTVVLMVPNDNDVHKQQSIHTSNYQQDMITLALEMEAPESY
jgi:hypothetical protein